MEAIFIGHKGEHYGLKYFMPRVWPTVLYFDKNGDVITNDKPESDPNYDHWAYVELTPGGACLLPSWNAELLEIALQSTQFAKPEAQSQINEWYQAGVDAKEIYRRLMEAGLVLLPQSPAPGEPKTGG